MQAAEAPIEGQAPDPSQKARSPLEAQNGQMPATCQDSPQCRTLQRLIRLTWSLAGLGAPESCHYAPHTQASRSRGRHFVVQSQGVVQAPAAGRQPLVGAFKRRPQSQDANVKPDVVPTGLLDCKSSTEATVLDARQLCTGLRQQLSAKGMLCKPRLKVVRTYNGRLGVTTATPRPRRDLQLAARDKSDALRL